MIKGRIATLENALEANPNDLNALEEEAISYAQLFEFEKAAGLLDKLVAARPKDSEAWRLLGETALLSQQPARAVGDEMVCCYFPTPLPQLFDLIYTTHQVVAYEKAAAINPDDLQVLHP